MWLRLLGAVEVHADDGRVLTLPRRQERCLLGILLLETGHTVAIPRLCALLWDDAPPDRAGQALRTYIARIRALLARAQASEAQASEHGFTLAADRGGYVLKVDPDAVDVHRFRRLLTEASATADLAERDKLLGEALALWRGPALQHAATDRLRQRLCADLDELHLQATEEHLATGVDLGRHNDVLSTVARLTIEHPTRQRLVEIQMRALHTAGRTADALEVYTRTRRHLADTLGLDPSPTLQRLHTAILRGQPLTPPTPPAPPASSPAPSPRHPTATPRQLPADLVPAQLPPDVAIFTGRAEHLATLDKLLPGHKGGWPTGMVVCAIDGTAGVGKTALAVHWAHQVADRFPDGQLYVNLRGFDPSGQIMDPAAAVRGFLDAVEVPPQRIPTDPDMQAALYRSLLADKRMLILLDNARDSAQVRPLLPGAPGCLVLVTSRNQLSTLIAETGAQPLSLDLLTNEEAVELLAHRLGTERIAAEPDVVTEIVDRCARLPLALTLVAARAALRPHVDLHILAEELRDTQQRWRTLAGDDPATDLRAVFSWSYHTLTPGAAQLFRLLGLHPGPDIGAPAAASLLGQPTAAVRPLMDELSRVNLIAEYTLGRYTLHDLLRAYATEQAHAVDSDGERLAATRRIFDHYLHTAYRADGLFNPHRDYRDPISVAPADPGVSPEYHMTGGQALEWFDTELPVLLAAIEQSAMTAFHTHTWQLAWSLAIFLDRQGRWNDLIVTQQTALDSAQRVADRSGQANAHHLLGRAHMWLGRQQDGDRHLRRALKLYRELADSNGEGRAQVDIAVRLIRWEGAPREALEHAQRAVDLYQATDHRAGEACALPMVSWCHTLLGDYEQAAADCRRALAILQELGDCRGESWSWKVLGSANQGLGKADEAIACFQHALDLLRGLGDRYQEADVSTLLGNTHHQAGNPTAASDMYRQALAILNELNHPDADRIQAKLDAIDHQDPS